MIKTAPSILSADFNILGAEIEDVRNCGADYIHFDVMDGIFVPNISIGIPVLSSVRKNTDMTLDAHLMIDRPLRYVKSFCDAGADIVTIHIESDTPENIEAAIDEVKARGKRAGLSVKPKTPASAVLPYIAKLDLVLVMTVEPGFGGQSFMWDMLPKIAWVRKIIDSHNPDCELEVDGGIAPDTAKAVKEAGANVLVAGSSVFRERDRKEIITAIREA